MNTLKNETDGFMATVLEPHETGLSMYTIFNCYGIYHATDGFLKVPKKHKSMILEVAVRDSTKSTRCKRFNWDEMIPVEVSETPRLLLKGRKLKKTLSSFDRQEWEDLYRFIVQNKSAIHRHWIGESSSLELFEEVKNGSERDID